MPTPPAWHRLKRLDEAPAPLYVARGVLYVQLAQSDKAEADFEKAYELDPQQSLSTAAHGLAAVQANDLDHALASIQAKLERKPNDPLLLYLQADVLSRQSAELGTPGFELALRSAKSAVRLQPTLGAARAVLAKLYMQTGQYAEAAAQCREALRSDPKDQTALYRLIQALRKTGQQGEIPHLLKRLAQPRTRGLREDPPAAHVEARHHGRLRQHRQFHSGAEGARRGPGRPRHRHHLGPLPGPAPFIESERVAATMYQRPSMQGHLAFQALYQFLVDGVRPRPVIRMAPHIVMKGNLKLFMDRLSRHIAKGRSGRGGSEGGEPQVPGSPLTV
jgi:hypothetical protein